MKPQSGLGEMEKKLMSIMRLKNTDQIWMKSKATEIEKENLIYGYIDDEEVGFETESEWEETLHSGRGVGIWV